ncbi:hypothetical protein JL722_1645 [Aureococcus anophagefferens]|nr:hypothetical protein JL722_1645 [Aureococcus anophagefferens]
MFLLGGLAPKASGQELAKLVASDAAEEDYFGRSVAVSGDLVVVGANQNDAAGIDSGSVYVFRTTNGGASWTQVAKLVASDAAADDEFGGSVAVSGDLVVVGRTRTTPPARPTSSATTNGGATWTQTAKLLASDAAAGDRFGYSVAISGDLVAKLVASDAAATDYFGYSVAVSGDLVVVGAYGNDDAGSKSGSAYVFRTTNDGASWTQVAKLVASDAAATDYFGYSVAVSGDLVRRPRRRRGGNADAGDWSGSAYVFRTTNDGASWTETAKLVACDAAAADSFGESVAISGDLVVLGRG